LAGRVWPTTPLSWPPPANGEAWRDNATTPPVESAVSPQDRRRPDMRRASTTRQ
jgi:hypothetical protein